MEPSSNSSIRLRGVRVHNLQSVDLDIPHDQLVVITGLSGSGKSSLAIDTVFAEGQRQYIESLSVYARQFFHQRQRPELVSVTHLPPAICIDQRSGMASPRSTVGTLSEIYDYLRILYARAGEPNCPKCGQPIEQQTPDEIARQLMALPHRTKVVLMAPLVQGKQGKHLDLYEKIRKNRLVRARVDGQIYDVDQLPDLKARQAHTIEAIVDRIVIREDIGPRLHESLALALDLGDGLITASCNEPEDSTDEWTDRVFNTRYACPVCGAGLKEIEPRTFSFNSPFGACPVCEGLGQSIQFDAAAVIADRSKSLADGAVIAWSGLTPAARKKRLAELRPILDLLKIDQDTPLAQLDESAWHQFLYHKKSRQPGLMIVLEREYSTTTQEARLEQLESFRERIACPECRGRRLQPAALSVRLGGHDIATLCEWPLTAVAEFFGQWQPRGTAEAVANRVVPEIVRRLNFLQKVGLEYLSLNRPVDTLSGGELQRTRLATAIGSGLLGICYVLDEPSIGLHARDNQRLLEALAHLRDQGNTVIVVEHDEATIRAADHVIDLGPGAGRFGGHVVAAGPPAIVAKSQGLTAAYLRGELTPPSSRGRAIDPRRQLTLRGACGFNLQDLDVEFPLGVMLCISGVSGSGKSTLIRHTLVPAVLRQLGQASHRPAPFRDLEGVEHVKRLVPIDQRPLGRTPRGCPATYSGVMTELRRLFAATRSARQYGLSLAHFSFNTSKGWCPQCRGFGQEKRAMSFLPEVYVTCPLCQGRRFNSQTLQVRYNDLTIADVLELPIAEAVAFFDGFERIKNTLSRLSDVGLGYLSLGQASATLSGGEAQRVRLATELASGHSGGTLYVLDEPTTGLHFDDIRRLMNVLQQLIDQNNSVLVIEHQLDVIAAADWIIDLGPEGGNRGGRVVAAGSPRDIANCEHSVTGSCLAAAMRTRTTVS